MEGWKIRKREQYPKLLLEYKSGGMNAIEDLAI
jgi:hypothetical protein